MLDLNKITIYKDTSGILKAKIAGKEECPLRPIRCFPFTAAEQYLVLFKIEPDGTINEEIALISDLKELDENSRKLIEEELNKVYSLIQITKIHSLKQSTNTIRWQVDTDKGERTFEAQEQRDICVIQLNLIVIKDAEGNRFRINPAQLDPKSLSLLERYI